MSADEIKINKIAEKKSVVNFELQAGTNELEEMEMMMRLNPVSFKIFRCICLLLECKRIKRN